MASSGWRVAYVVVALLLVVLGFVLLASYLDSPAGYDSSCTNAFGYWTGDRRYTGCRPHMIYRAIAAPVAVVLAIGYLALAIAPRTRDRLGALARPRMIAVILFLVAAALIWNETLRSGGLWES